MKVLITGAGGLIGFESCKFFLQRESEVIGIDNNMRRYFFGEGGDTTKNIEFISNNYQGFKNCNMDIRDRDKISQIFKENGPFDLILHTAAQPSHDWAAKEPYTDFDINATGTHNLLESFRLHSPKGAFIFTSTNKVYGDNPNKIPLKELEKKWEYDLNAEFKDPEIKIGVSEKGINEKMSLDNCKHSIFGASKVAADIMAQEYGKYFGLNIGIFRGGCLTGPQHSAVELHGFLTYIVDCAIKGRLYNIFGYNGKQVRDQIHSFDVVNAFWHFYKNPKQGEVYNLGGTKLNAASILDIIELLEKDFDLKLNYQYLPENRKGDHICYYSDMSKFKSHYPDWTITKRLKTIIEEIVQAKKQ